VGKLGIGAILRSAIIGKPQLVELKASDGLMGAATKLLAVAIAPAVAIRLPVSCAGAAFGKDSSTNGNTAERLVRSRNKQGMRVGNG
jgi:hypothetical protein